MARVGEYFVRVHISVRMVLVISKDHIFYIRYLNNRWHILVETNPLYLSGKIQTPFSFQLIVTKYRIVETVNKMETVMKWRGALRKCELLEFTVCAENVQTHFRARLLQRRTGLVKTPRILLFC